MIKIKMIKIVVVVVVLGNGGSNHAVMMMSMIMMIMMALAVKYETQCRPFLPLLFQWLMRPPVVVVVFSLWSAAKL